MRSRVKRLLCLRWTVKPLCAVLLLLVSSVAATEEPAPPDYPHERAKDLTSLYGRYEIYEAVEYRGSITNTADEGQAWVGQELIVTASLFRYPTGLRIENPTYTVWFYPYQPEGVVVHKSEWWSSAYLEGGGQAEGDEVIKVYKPGGSEPDGPWVYLEIIGTNELWVRFSGWYYKARKTDRLPLSAGHDDYCQVMGPCSAGQGDCGSASECQSELTCAEAVCQ